jgi:hypothetical protein
MSSSALNLCPRGVINDEGPALCDNVTGSRDGGMRGSHLPIVCRIGAQANRNLALD